MILTRREKGTVEDARDRMAALCYGPPRSKLIIGCVFGVPVAPVLAGGRRLYKVLPPIKVHPSANRRRQYRIRSLRTAIYVATVLAYMAFGEGR